MTQSDLPPAFRDKQYVRVRTLKELGALVNRIVEIISFVQTCALRRGCFAFRYIVAIAECSSDVEQYSMVLANEVWRGASETA